MAVLILQFHFEIVGHVDEDGRRVDGAPQPRSEYAGGGVMAPDRDILVRWRRCDI